MPKNVSAFSCNSKLNSGKSITAGLRRQWNRTKKMKEKHIVTRQRNLQLLMTEIYKKDIMKVNLNSDFMKVMFLKAVPFIA